MSDHVSYLSVCHSRCELSFMFVFVLFQVARKFFGITEFNMPFHQWHFFTSTSRQHRKVSIFLSSVEHLSAAIQFFMHSRLFAISRGIFFLMISAGFDLYGLTSFTVIHSSHDVFLPCIGIWKALNSYCNNHPMMI